MKIDDKGSKDPNAPIKEIGTVNPIADFKKMTIGDNKNDRVEEAVEQMVALIKRFIASSMNNDQYGKAFECLVALREVCVIDDEAVPFNNLAKELKKNNDFFALM